LSKYYATCKYPKIIKVIFIKHNEYVEDKMKLLFPFITSYNQDFELLKFILNNFKPNIHTYDEYIFRTLYICKKYEMLDYLIEYGIKTNQPYNGDLMTIYRDKLDISTYYKIRL
jgi:hypothetical protein